MEFKDITTWSVSKGIAKPVDTRSKEDISLIIGEVELQLAKSRERIVRLKFEQFAKQHTYTTNAPDGSYSADCFGEIVWQLKGTLNNYWVTINENHGSYKLLPVISDESKRQFLPFIDQVKEAEITQAEVYETPERLKQLAKSIRLNTIPIKGHTDPESLVDCWNELDYVADSLFSLADVKRIAFRCAELTEIYKIHNPHPIAHLHTNYDQVIKNRGKVVGMPKDH